MVFGEILQGVVSFFKGIAPKIKQAWKAADIYGKVGMVFTAATVAVGVKGFLEMREMLGAGQSIMANKTAAGGKIPVIYGTRRVGTQIVYMDTFGNDNRDLYVVYALAVGECEEILGRTIEIDGNSILDEKIFKKGGYVGSDKISSGAGSLCTADQNGDTNAAVGGGLGTDPTRRYQFVFNLHHGADSQTADPMLRASIPNAWSTNHKLNGICYIAAHFHYSKTGVFQGVPQITVQVKGKKVYDPRESGHTFGDPSTYEWSSNPALCYLDYITNDSYGKGLAESDINMSTFETAATKCDVEVDQPYYNGAYQSVTWSGTSGDDFIVINDNDEWYQNKTDEVFDLRDNGGSSIFTGSGRITGVQRHQFYDDDLVNKIFINETLTSTYTNEAGSARAKVKRFHCNGYIDTNKSVMDNSKELLANMRGIFSYINGKYELQIEDTGSSTFSITEDHIIGSSGLSIDYGNKDKKANKVVIEFYNSQLDYELDTATVLHDATPEYYSDDGEILEVKAQFPLITDAYIAYNMGKAILTRSRNQMSIRFLGTPEMYKLNVGDIVDITYAGLDLSTKICRVEALELQSNGLVGVSLIEYFDVYTWEVPAQEDARKLLKIPTRGAIHPPEASSIVFTDTDASPINRPTLTWTEPDDFDVKEFRVDVVDSSDNNVFSKRVNTPSVDLSFLPKASNYEASITCFNTFNVESEPVTKTFTIADDPVKTTEVEIGSETLSNIIDYGTVTGQSGNWFQINGRLDLEDRFIWNSNGDNYWALGTAGDDDVNLKIEGGANTLIQFKDQDNALGTVKLAFGDDVGGDYSHDFIHLVADYTQGEHSTDAKSIFYIKGRASDGSSVSGDIAKFTFGAADGIGFPSSVLYGTTTTPILIAEDYIEIEQATAPSTTTDKLYNVSGTLYWNGGAVNTGAGDITSVTINTAGGGLTGGASFSSGDATFTLAIGSNIQGDKTFSDDIVIEGDLTVQGTTTTIDTTNLDVKDKNITLNYGTGDTSANADGAGITIQDAVSSTQDATILWDTTSDDFNFSHPISVTGNITSSNSLTSQSINVSSSGYGVIEVGGVSGAYIDLKRPNTDDYDLRLISFGTGGEIDTGSGDLVIKRQGSTRIATTSSGIDVTGDVAINSDDLVVSSSNSRVGINVGTPLATLDIDGDVYVRTGHTLFTDILRPYATTTLTIGQTTNDIAKFTGSIKIGNSTIVDSSRNLTNIGTISSGAITVTSTVAGTTASTFSGNYSASGDVKLAVFERSGGAVASAIEYNDATTDMEFGTTTSHSFSLKTADTRRLTIDSSGNSTFTGTISSGAITSTGQFSVNTGATGTLAQFRGADTDLLNIDGDSNAITLDARNVGAFNIEMQGTNALTIDNSQNATFTGTISSGDITITGDFPRLYFVDTAGTDLDAYIVNNANGLFFGKTNTPSASNDVMALDLTNKRVGIGTSTPDGKLHIESSSSGATAAGGGDELILESSATTGLSILSGTANDGNILFGDSGNSAIGYVQYKHADNALNFGVNGGTKATIDSSGNVGIGTTDPNAGLQIAKGGTSVPSAGADTGSAVFGNTTSNNAYGLVVGANNAGLGYISAQRTDGTATTYNLSIQPNGGNVGIGTQNPTTTLDVVNSSAGNATIPLVIRNSGSTSVGTEAKLFLSTVADNLRGAYISAKITDTSNGNAMLFATNTAGAAPTERMRISSAGAVSITADASNEQLTIKRASNTNEQLIFGFHSSDYGWIQSVEQGVAYRPLILNRDGGNVGIGTTAPNAKLELNVASGDGLLIKSADVSTIKMKGSGSVTDWGFAATYQAAGDFGIYASNSAGGDPITAGTAKMYFTSAGNVGIGTTSPNEILHVHKSTTPRILLTDATTGTTSGSDGMFLGIAGDQGLNIWNYENTYTRFAVNNDEKMRIDSSGNVGIGTSSPSGKLDVAGVTPTLTISDTQDKSWTSSDTTLGELAFRTRDSSGIGSHNVSFIRAVNEVASSTTPSGALSFGISQANNNASEAMRISADGKVGIGTDSPAYPLDVRKNQAGYTYISSDNANTAASGTGSGFAMTESGTVAWYMRSERDGTGKFNIGNSANRMTIDSTGKVGIGTTSPSSLNSGANRLVVGGGANFEGLTVYSAVEGGIYFADGTSGSETYKGVVKYEHSNDSMQFTTNATERMRIDSSGRVGIGTNSPSSLDVNGNRLVVGGGSGNEGMTIFSGTTGLGTILFADGNDGSNAEYRGWMQYEHTNDSLEFATASAERMRIDSSGRLLVGKTSDDGTAGVRIGGSGTIVPIASGIPIIADRLSSDGEIIRFRKDGSTVGSIGSRNGNSLFIALNNDTNNDAGITGSTANGGSILPCEITDGGILDNSISLGTSAARFKDLYLSGTISSGDINIGTADTTNGTLTIHGGGTGNAEGGEIRLGLSADHDGTYDHYRIDTYQDDLRIGRQGNTDFYIFQDGKVKVENNFEVGGTITATGDISTDGELQVDSNAQIDGNLGIGGAASSELHIISEAPIITATATNTLSGLRFNIVGGASALLRIQDNGTERARIDSSGNLLVGATSETSWETAKGFRTRQSGSTTITRDGNPPLYINRLTSDGVVMVLKRGTATKGQIGILSSVATSTVYFASGSSSSSGTGLKFVAAAGANQITPCRGDGTNVDNVIDLGSSVTRFDDIYATNGTIQTSDRNEKQDIQELSDAEQRVAIACKGLIRRYKFNSAVAEKGDDARYHFGIIAQDLQDAFTAEGLDAGDYGMFISNTWTDEEGNEQTRLGVRYNELLAFIIATL